MLAVEAGKCHLFWQSKAEGACGRQYNTGSAGPRNQHPKWAALVWRVLIHHSFHTLWIYLKACPQMGAEEPGSAQRGLAVLSSAAVLGLTKMSQMCWIVEEEAGVPREPEERV